jgi:hypothetical protein
MSSRPEITWLSNVDPRPVADARPAGDTQANGEPGAGGERIENPRASEGCEARVRFPAGCAWFDGHFPDGPVLPGVALLSLVRAAVARRRWPDPPARTVTGFGRVRFRQPVLPDELLRLALRPSRRERSLRFVISRDTDPRREPVCDGLARWAEAEPTTVAGLEHAWRWR